MKYHFLQGCLKGLGTAAVGDALSCAAADPGGFESPYRLGAFLKGMLPLGEASDKNHDAKVRLFERGILLSFHEAPYVPPKGGGC